jgi:thiamine-monophosphate kinase
MALSEFELIERYFARLGAPRDDVVLGVGDDAALLDVPVGLALAVSADTCIAGVHFPRDLDPCAAGHRALAVNLSDLAAMGARPAWFTLCLTLPEARPEWLEPFAAGLAGLAMRHGVALIGGDVTRGPETVITIQVLGHVQPGRALRRHGARVGDLIQVTGTLGDAALALDAWRRGPRPCGGDAAALWERLAYPAPRVEAGQRLLGLATSAIDISDGLAQDLGHILRGSGVGATVHLDRLPLSAAALRCASEAAARAAALTGGDDYELVYTVPPHCASGAEAALAELGLQVSSIGIIEAMRGLRVLDGYGAAVPLTDCGFRHF